MKKCSYEKQRTKGGTDFKLEIFLTKNMVCTLHFNPQNACQCSLCWARHGGTQLTSHGKRDIDHGIE